MPDKFFIGLVAPKGAGKGTFIRILRDLLTNHSVERVSSGELLGEIVELVGKPKTRENLQKIPVALEAAFGKGIVSDMVGKKLRESAADIAIFDGVRWDSDVAMLKNLGSEENTQAAIVYITADAPVRHERSRKRNEKAGESSATLKEFLEQEKAQTEIAIKHIGKQYSDFHITNNGTEDEMLQQISEFVRDILDIQI